MELCFPRYFNAMESLFQHSVQLHVKTPFLRLRFIVGIIKASRYRPFKLQKLELFENAAI